MAAGSVVATISTIEVGNRLSIYKKYSLAWTSSAGGAVSGNSFSVVAGRIIQARFTPNGGGTQPSDAYDVTLVDTDAYDLLLAQGANLSNAAPSVYSYTQPGLFQDGTRVLDLVVANAGNAKGGTVEFLVQVK